MLSHSHNEHFKITQKNVVVSSFSHTVTGNFGLAMSWYKCTYTGVVNSSVTLSADKVMKNEENKKLKY